MIKFGIESEAYVNIMNFPYPVSRRTYNRYYFIFYSFEVVLGVYYWYSTIIFNFIFISFAFVLSTQYEIVTQALENIGQDQKEGNS